MVTVAQEICLWGDIGQLTLMNNSKKSKGMQLLCFHSRRSSLQHTRHAAKLLQMQISLESRFTQVQVQYGSHGCFASKFEIVASCFVKHYRGMKEKLYLYNKHPPQKNNNNNNMVAPRLLLALPAR